MGKNNSILAIDIGSESLKIAEFSYPQAGGMVLDNFAFIEYSDYSIEDNDTFEYLGELFKGAIEDNAFSSKNVHVTISGQSAFVRHVKLPVAGDDIVQIRQMVEYEAQQNIPFPMDEIVWDYQLIKSEEEGAGFEVVFVVVKNEIIDKITDAIETTGCQVNLIEVAPTATYNAARANGIGETPSMILNIGGRCSTLVFIEGERIFVRSIPIAGDTITQQISKEFGISFKDAEEMKRRHGFVALGGAYEEPDSEVAATVSKIVRNVMTRLHGELNRSISVYRSQQKGNKPTKLYLAGGSSVMAFTPRFFSDKLRIPVEYLNPFQVISLSEDIDKEYLAEVAHMFTEIIGLGLRKLAVCPIEISLIPDLLKRIHAMKRKVPYIYASAVSLILCLGILLWGTTRRTNQEVKNTNAAMKQVELAQKNQRSISKLEKEKTLIYSRYDEAVTILDGRTEWVNLYNNIQVLLPDSTWLTSINSGAGGSVAVTPKKTGGGHGLWGGKSKKKVAKNTSKTQYDWIKVSGHSLYEKDRVQSYLGDFKKNLIGSDMFVAIPEEKQSFKKSDYSISTFSMEIKLKNKIGSK